MSTQKEIKEWIPRAVEIFRRFMPPTDVPMPSIHVVSDRTLFQTRARLVEKVRCHQASCDEQNYDAAMETLHGELGDAIIIRQKYVPSPKEIPLAECYFQHFFWHELGHFYAIHHECRSSYLHRFCDQELSDERAKQEGYWFWSEFIAEAIALYVDEQHCRIDNSHLYQPEKITWEPLVWDAIDSHLLDLLTSAFVWYDTTIDESSLAMYFATLLMDDATKRYVKAAGNGELLVYDSHMKTRLMEPGSIDPTCITEQAEAYQEPLLAMKGMLEVQMKKEHFWEIDEDWLETLGQHIVDMTNSKILMLASEIGNYDESLKLQGM